MFFRVPFHLYNGMSKKLPAWKREELQMLRTKMACVLERKKKIAKDEVSSSHNLPIMFKHPIQGDARIHDVLVNSDMGNPEVEVKVMGDARCTKIEEFGSQWEIQTGVSEDDAGRGDVASMSEPVAQPHYVEEDQEQRAKYLSGLATATTTSQLQTPNAKSKKQEASGPPSPSSGVLSIFSKILLLPFKSVFE